MRTVTLAGNWVILTYTNKYKQGSCSKELSQAQIMIFCNREVDEVRWFEGSASPGYSELKEVKDDLVWICLPEPTAGDPGEQWEREPLFVPVQVGLQRSVPSGSVQAQRRFHYPHHVCGSAGLENPQSSSFCLLFQVTQVCFIVQWVLPPDGLPRWRFPVPENDCWSQRDGAVPKLRILGGGWESGSGEAGAMKERHPNRLNLIHFWLKKNLLLSPFRMAVTLCAALEVARKSPPTEAFLRNLQRTIQRSEMTTCYLCDPNIWKCDSWFHCVTAFSQRGGRCC